jgi:hypothetical protein
MTGKDGIFLALIVKKHFDSYSQVRQANGERQIHLANPPCFNLRKLASTPRPILRGRSTLIRYYWRMTADYLGRISMGCSSEIDSFPHSADLYIRNLGIALSTVILIAIMNFRKLHITRYGEIFTTTDVMAEAAGAIMMFNIIISIMGELNIWIGFGIDRLFLPVGTFVAV